MSHGTSKVIKRSKIRPQLRDTILTADYFISRPQSGQEADKTNYVEYNNPRNEIDEAVFAFLGEEGYDYSNKLVEYWFQYKMTTENLEPHCDYNHLVRMVGCQNEKGWVHKVPKQLLMSPITIAVYLEIPNDMKGGELCISDKDWFDLEDPLKFSTTDLILIKNSSHEKIIPKQDEVLYFEGSRYFHWINTIANSTRKSMLINFWPLELDESTLNNS